MISLLLLPLLLLPSIQGQTCDMAGLEERLARMKERTEERVKEIVEEIVGGEGGGDGGRDGGEYEEEGGGDVS